MEPSFKLPLYAISQSDVSRIARELNNLEDFFLGAAVRQTGTPMQIPKLTRSLNQLAVDNKYNLLDKKDRQQLLVNLNQALSQAPVLHISFAVEPSPKVLEPILVWLRDNIHPYCLLQVGLQPTIAIGCVLRTPNKVFDMSMRNYLAQQEQYLVELIVGAVREH